MPTPFALHCALISLARSAAGALTAMGRERPRAALRPGGPRLGGKRTLGSGLMSTRALPISRRHLRDASQRRLAIRLTAPAEALQRQRQAHLSAAERWDILAEEIEWMPKRLPKLQRPKNTWILFETDEAKVFA